MGAAFGNGLDVAAAVILAACIVAGFGIGYFLSQQQLKQAVADLRREMEERLNAISAQVQAAKAGAVVAAPVVTPVAPPVAIPAAKVAAPPPPKEEVSPDTLLVLAAAVTAFLGKKVRIRSAKMLYAHESFNAWSQQGRVVVQASHNLAQRY